MFLENYRTLMKEIEDDRNRRKDRLGSWIGRINIVKITTFPEAIYRFNVISNKIPMAFFTEVGQIILKLLWKYTQKTPNSQNYLEKEE